MSDDKEKKGGFTVGGISFGVGGQSKQVARADGAEAPRKASASAPLERDEALMSLRVLAVGDFIPANEFNAGINPPEHPITVEAAGIDQAFAKLAPKLALEVESVLKDGQKVRVDVALTSLASFRPDGLCKDVPLLRSLLDGRKVLERLRDGSVSVEAAGSELARLWSGSPLVSRVLGGVEIKQQASFDAGKAASQAAGDSGDAASRILDMVGGGGADDGNGASAPAPRPAASAPSDGGRFSAFIAAVAHSGKNKAGARPDEAIRLVEKALGLQLGAVLQHPEFRRLEESWRGLAFVVGRMPKRGVRLDVVSCRKEEAAAALARTAAANPGIDPPVSFAVVDGTVGSDAASLAWLRALGEAAEEHTLPVLTNAAPALTGTGLAAIDRLDNKQALFEARERAPWRAEAHRPALLWVSLGLNRVVARAPYDAKSSRIREAEVTEQPAEPGWVWMQPCWALASLAVKSFEKHEWPCGITGARDGGVIGDLPVREIEVNDEKLAIPTEAFFSTETQRALGRIGLTALASQPNTDEAYLLSAATAYVTPPKRTYDGASTDPEVRLPQASLSDQLFVARLAQYLRALGAKIGRDEPADDVKQFLEAAVGEMFRNAAPSGPEVTVSVSGGEASVTIRPRRFLGVSMEEITLGVPLA